MNAELFIHELTQQQSTEHQAKNLKHYKGSNPETAVLGVRMGNIFKLAKTYTDLPLDGIETLLDSSFYEVRMGAVSIMDYQARRKRLSAETRTALYNLYLTRHDRIDTWDLIDRAAPWVIGRYLHDKPKTPLYTLAQSQNQWERRTAIVSSYYFVKQGDTTDALQLANHLIHDKSEFVQKPVGTLLREIGAVNADSLHQFLDQHIQNTPNNLTPCTGKIRQNNPNEIHEYRQIDQSNP